MAKADISQIRRDYNQGSFSEKSAAGSPFEQFDKWLSDAKELDFPDPTAMALSTVNSEGMPSSRIVLLKNFDDRGFVFFTNYDSKKGKELSHNKKASVLFFWDKLERQVRIEGTIEKATSEESDAYYQTRPYTSRIGAWASKQSETLKSRFTLLREVAGFVAKYPINTPLPPYWGGYRLVPNYFEFWQGRPSRLHDRIVYELINNEWKKKRIYP